MGDESERFCAACGTTTEEGQPFCAECGRRVRAPIIRVPDDQVTDPGDDIQTWEYLMVTSGTIRKGSLVDRLNILGREGWQVVGFVQSDRTIGINSLEVLMKRPLPEVIAQDEAPSPSRRISVRSGKGFDEDVLADDGFACLECGQMIPPRAPNCPHCGWAWD